MSSRRTAGEENILAMLERDSARRAGGRISSPRLAWYCAAAAFAGILVGVVAWLAYDNHVTATALQVEAERIDEPPAAPASEPPAPADAPPPAPAPTQLAEAPRAAVIVDQPEESPAGPPPLVMLPPEETGAARAAAALKEAPPAPQPETAPAPKPAPAPKAARTEDAKQTRKDDMPVKSAKADKTEKAPKAEKAEKARRPAARAARPAAQRGAVADKTPAHKRKHAPGPASDTPVDSDVALISAIIQHSERHRNEGEQAAPCKGRKCPAPPRR